MKQSSEVEVMARDESAIKADKARDEAMDNIRLRVVKGASQIIQDYVLTLPQYCREIERKVGDEKIPVTEPNVNLWITDIIKSNLPRECADQIERLEQEREDEKERKRSERKEQRRLSKQSKDDTV